MSELSNRIRQSGGDRGVRTEPTPDHPTIVWKGDTGIAEWIATDPTEDFAAAEDALRGMVRVMLGPAGDAIKILDITEVRGWGRDPHTGRPYTYFKAKVSRPRAAAEQAAVDSLVDRATSLRARKPARERKTGEPAEWIVGWADCQAGKAGERFGDTHSMLDRADFYIDEGLPRQHRQLTSAGKNPTIAHLVLLGDLTEGVDGSYANQTHSVELNASEQLEVAVALAHRAVDRLAGLVPRVRVTGVSSNHDQASRGSGKDNITDDFDDRTFTVLRTLARIVDSNPDRYASVDVVMPDDPNVAVFRAGGIGVAALHGHKPKHRVSPRETLLRWRNGQAKGRTPAGRCQLVLAGHYHHRYEIEDSGCKIIGHPSMDGGSKFLTDATGTWSLPGLRSTTVTDGRVGIHDLFYPPDIEVAQQHFGAVAA